jgi:NAD(P)-dependent dehydrogenase (short-subunit alcohol dehydrogenase family)
MLREWDDRSPGIIERLTATNPPRRMAGPEEIAQAAAWPLRGCSSYVTGTVLRVDGGARA